MKTIGFVLAAALWASAPARAAVVAGRDCAGQDLVCDGATPLCGGASVCSNGDELQGTFTRVGLFSLPAGTTVFVFPATPLVIYASTVSIGGTIDGVGRGVAGGAGGANLQAGQAGAGGSLAGSGGGGAGPASPGGTSPGKGGGGGGHGDYGGLGAGSGVAGSSGAPVGAAAFSSSPVSPDDVHMGSGGGGGGGGPSSSLVPGGSGGPGGASVYLEASSVTFYGSGSILVNGGAGSTVGENTVSGHPGGGGGGAGGGILVRVPGALAAGGLGSLSANGGRGSTMFFPGGQMNPGGGGSGGRIKLFYRSAEFGVAISTALGVIGNRLQAGTFESTSSAAGFSNNGSSGTAAFGVIASSPTGVYVDAVHLASVTWGWSFAGGASAWGDAAESSRRFRVYPSSISAPYPGYQAQSSSDVFKSTETGMAANTWYTRVVTAFTDWGDSLFSTLVTTVTYAGTPGPPVGVSTFTDVQERRLTLSWGHGSGAEANPSDTEYEVWRSTLPDFSVASSTRIVAVSSTPVNLTPETVYYFRIRAVNRAGTLTPFTTTFAIATSTTPPSAPGAPMPDNPFSYDGRAVFRWSAASAPSGIKEYYLEIGSFPGGADFLSQSVGSVLTYSVAGPLFQSGRTYYARVRAVSNANVTSDFSAAGSPVSVFITAQETPVAKPSSWPNPFDPSAGPANIGFSVSEPATVQLKIFTLQGKLVYEETRRYDSIGNKVWLWDAKSSGGRKIAPGGYVVVIHKRYAGGVDTQKFKMAIIY